MGCTPVIFPRIGYITRSKINDTDMSIVLSPNPNNGSFKLYNINFKDFENENIKLEIYDLKGRILHKQVLNQSDIDQPEIEVTNLTSGIYFVKLATAKKVVDIKFIKK